MADLKRLEKLTQKSHIRKKLSRQKIQVAAYDISVRQEISNRKRLDRE